jgi:RNA polymerase sigma factor (sigma-70 family)
MTEPPQTRPSLLVRLRNAQDNDAWRQFVQLYAPLLYRYARRHRLQDADAADLTQEVLRAVNGAIGQLDYDHRRGTFHGWLFTLAHHKLCDFFTRQRRQQNGSGDSSVQEMLHDVPAPQPDDWERDHERRLFTWAAEQARAEFTEATWQAFWQTAVDGRAGRDVAAALGMSVGAVYIAKSRVQARLKKLIEQVRDSAEAERLPDGPARA